MRVYWTTLSFLSISSLVYIYIFSESFLIKDYYWQYASKKIQIVWIHTVAACCSDLLLNFNTSCFISFPLNWISVFSWRNGKKSCSLTSCVACSRFRDSRESANTNIKREETGERRGPLLLFLCPRPVNFSGALKFDSRTFRRQLQILKCWEARSKPQGGGLGERGVRSGFQVTGMIKGSFLVWSFRFQIRLGRKILARIFWGQLDLWRDFLGYSNNMKIHDSYII